MGKVKGNLYTNPSVERIITNYGTIKQQQLQSLVSAIQVRKLFLGILISIMLNLVNDLEFDFTNDTSEYQLFIPETGPNPKFTSQTIRTSMPSVPVVGKNNHTLNKTTTNLENERALRSLDDTKIVIPKYNYYTFYENMTRFEDDSNHHQHIWFITATSLHTVQQPVLVRIAQALFGVRHFVTWVIVQDTNSILKEKTSRVSSQLKKLQLLLSRFGIHYVLLHSRMYRSHKRIEGILPAGSEHKQVWEISARQTGLIWVLENTRWGIVVLADVEFTFNSQIFYEIRQTKKFSMWPVGLGRNLGLSSPIVAGGQVIGYHNGDGISENTVMLDLSSFAFNLSFIRNNIETENLWKFTFDGRYSADSIGIKLEDIEPIASNCTKILVWRTNAYVLPLPTKVKFNFTWMGTNVERVLRDIYGLKYRSIMGLNDTESKNVHKGPKDKLRTTKTKPRS